MVRVVLVEHQLPGHLLDQLDHGARRALPDGETVGELIGEFAGLDESVGQRLAAQVEELGDLAAAYPAG